MEVHSSEQDSEYSNSNMESLSQRSSNSPVSSPSQIVPRLAQAFRGITCNDGLNVVTVEQLNTGPCLRITEQPMRYFRFRYKSEMVGTHGCILGRSSGPRQKTHPAAELMNWLGPAIIRVQLAQADCEDDHPHKLLEDDEDRDVIAQLPQQGSYRVAFPGMGIIHTAKKDVPGLLFTKKMRILDEPDIKKELLAILRTEINSAPARNAERRDAIMMSGQIRSHCEAEAKKIDLNKVRLVFTAHHPETNLYLCPPVYSEPIHNMKSASTNDLKICRISRVSGRARGGDDVYLLVEKVNKKHIKVRFFELDNYGEQVWEGWGNFLQTDVHHQYAIVVRTPPYKNADISQDVKVFIELVRPTDGRFSEPKEFTYKADPVFKNKKRRINSSISSIGSCSGESLSSIGDIPVTVAPMSQIVNGDLNGAAPVYHIDIEIPQAPTYCMQPPVQPSNDLADALLYDAGATMTEQDLSPMLSHLSQPPVSEPPIIQINSSEFHRLIHQDQEMSLEEKNMLRQADLNAYMQLYNTTFQSNKSNSMDFVRTSMQLVADSGQDREIKQEIKLEPIGSSQTESTETNVKMVDRMKNLEYKAHYTAEDGHEVKMLTKEICQIIKNKDGFKKYVVCKKLERLMALRLSNGDTFLHMTLLSNQPSFEYIVRLIHSLRLTRLLNYHNDLGQTILHLAVVNDLPAVVSLLIANGCSISTCDRAGLPPLHYAVSRPECLRALIDALPYETRSYLLDEAINVYCNEKQTPLHLAAIDNEAESARMLLEAGADFSARDLEGRTPLHLATYDDYLDVTKALLEFIPPSDIDAVDGRGNTALQIVCGAGMRTNTLAIAELLLHKKADPVNCWHLTRDEALRALLKAHVLLHDHEVIKAEPEDEFESADDGESNTAVIS